MISKLIYIIKIFIDYSKKSFESIDMWIKHLKTYSKPDIKIFLIGNKSDLEEKREVSTEEAQQLKENYQLDFYMETSAKSGFNVNELFIEAAKILYEDYNYYQKDKKDKNIKLPENVEQNNEREHKSCCC